MTRRGRGWLIAGAAVALLLAVALATLPELLRRAAITHLGAATGQTVAIQSLDINIFTGQLRVHAFSLGNGNTPDPLLQIARVDASIRLLPLLDRHLHIDRLTLTSFTIQFARTKETDLALADVLLPLYGGEALVRRQWDVTIEQVQMEGGTIILQDRLPAPPQTWRAEELTLKAHNLSTQDASGSGTIRLDFRVRESPASVTVTDLRLAPARGHLTASLTGLALNSLHPYLSPPTRARLRNGRLDGELRMRYAGGSPPEVEAKLRLANLTFQRPQEKSPFFSIPELAVTLDGLTGNLDALSVAQVVLAGDPLFVDTSFIPPVTIGMKRARLTAKEISWPMTRLTPITLTATLPSGGRLKAKGSLRLPPFETDLRVALTQTDLAFYRPYLSVALPVSGRAEADFRLIVRPPQKNQTVRTTARGAVSARGFSIGTKRQQMVAVERLEAAGVELSWPSKISVERITLHRPTAHIERDPSGRFPWGTLWSGASTPNSAHPTPEKTRIPKRTDPKKGLKEKVIRDLIVENGAIRFSDHTLSPPYRQELTGVTLTLSGLSERRGRVTVHGIIGGGGALELQGQMDFAGKDRTVDLAGELRDFGLQTVNPYLARILGREARRGGLYTKAHYQVQGDHLSASHQIVITGLELTDVTDQDVVSQQVGLPMGLLLDLLKNKEGEIHLDLPVSGTLTEPEFSLREAVWGAAKKAIVDMVTAPFRSIGRLAASEGKIESVEINPLEFEPGSADLRPDTSDHLQRIREFLGTARSVQLKLFPVVTAIDLLSLKTQTVQARIQRLQQEQQVDYPVATQRLFTRRFPNRALPGGVDEMVMMLRDAEPIPEAAGRELAARRLAAIHHQLMGPDSFSSDRLIPSPSVLSLGGPGVGRIEVAVAE